MLGDNSVFKQASEAKLKTDIAKYQEMLEVAKGPIMIEGLGTFDPDAYFQYIQDQGIINNKDTDVVDNGDGTYDVTTKPGYIFLVTLMPTKERPTDAEIEYLGQEGKLEPKLKRIIVTEKTKTSINIKVSARPEGGEVKCYYKKASEIVEGEAENNIEGYASVVLDANLAGSITGLTEGESYKIKAVLQKDGKDIRWISIQERTLPLITVTSITLDKTTAKMSDYDTLQLTATVKPDNAEDKTVTWSTSDSNIALVDQTGKVTGKGVGTVTITVTANDGSGVSASCEITITDLWEKMNRIAKAIANDNNIDSNSMKAIGRTELNEEYDINVGDIFKVKYNGTVVSVRVLGFKYDDLVNKEVYNDGREHEKASINFEFVDIITRMAMNSSNTSSGGWISTQMRKELNGYTTNAAEQNIAIGGEGAKLSNSVYIKQVKKIYNPIYNSSSTNSKCNDYLWLLSGSEIWPAGAQSGANYGCAKAKEGEQYQYYIGKTTGGNGYNSYLDKGGGVIWWYRSPYYDSVSGKTTFCTVTAGGATGQSVSSASSVNGVVPGFCI